MPTLANISYFYHPGETNRLPLVLLHGAGGSRLYWPAELRRLSGYPVYAPDLPGHGESGGTGYNSVGAYAGEVRDWLSALDLPAAVLVGHSLGSAIALTLAVEHPQQVRALGLIGASGRLRVHPDILASTSRTETFEEAIRLVIAWGFSPAAAPRLVELAARRMMATDPAVLHADFVAANAFDLRDRLDQVRQPALVICGAEDQLTPLRYAEDLVARLPAARLEVVSNAGHMVMLEQPRAVAAVLKAFLDGLEGGDDG